MAKVTFLTLFKTFFKAVCDLVNLVFHCFHLFLQSLSLSLGLKLFRDIVSDVSWDSRKVIPDQFIVTSGEPFQWIWEASRWT